MCTAEETLNRHVTIRIGPWSKYGGDVWVTFSFATCGWLDECLSGRRDGTRIHYGKKASWHRQYDIMNNVLLGNRWVFHLYETFADQGQSFIAIPTRYPLWKWILLAGSCSYTPHCKNCSGRAWGTCIQGIDLASKPPRSQSDLAYLRCNGETSQIHWSPSLQDLL